MRWLYRCVHSGIEMHTSRIHQHMQKNSVWLKEVLTRRRASTQRTSIDNAAKPSNGNAKNARRIDNGNCQYCGNRLYDSVFVIRIRRGRCANTCVVSRRGRLTARCVDSESRILAMKIFSCSPASCLGRARQSRSFCESRSPIRKADFRLSDTPTIMVND